MLISLQWFKWNIHTFTSKGLNALKSLNVFCDIIKIHTVKLWKKLKWLIYLQHPSDMATKAIQHRTFNGLFQVCIKHINHVLSQNLIKCITLGIWIINFFVVIIESCFIWFKENKKVKNKVNPQLTGTRHWGSPGRSQGFTRFISNKLIT